MSSKPLDPISPAGSGQPDHGSPEDPDLAVALATLKLQTERLRNQAQMIVICALFVLLCLAATGFLRFLPVSGAVRIYLPVLGVAFAFTGILLLAMWEKRRREAMIVYEEVSDEVEWRHRTHHNGAWTEEEKHDKKKAGLPIRVVLRRFLSATELPFTSGSVSSLTYALYFVLCVVCFVVIMGLTDEKMNFMR